MYVDIASQDMNDDDETDVQRMEMDVSVQVCIFNILQIIYSLLLFCIYVGHSRAD